MLNELHVYRPAPQYACHTLVDLTPTDPWLGSKVNRGQSGSDKSEVTNRAGTPVIFHIDLVSYILYGYNWKYKVQVRNRR